MRLIGVVAALVVTCGPAFGQGVTGNVIFEKCNGYPGIELEDAAFCSAYIVGAWEGIRNTASNAAFEQLGQAVDEDSYNALKNSYLQNACVPKGASYSQVIDVFIKYLKDYPEDRHLRATDLLLASLAIAFPCD